MKAILFDLDDTLYPEMDFVSGGFKAVAAYLAARHRADAHALYQQMLAILGEHGRGQIFNRVLEDLDLYTEERLKLLVYLYRTHQPALTAYADAIPVLEDLRAAGVRLGMITDGIAAVQRRKIAALGFASLFDVIVCTDELGREHWKPSPLPFFVASEWLGVRPEECAYVGDDPSKDFAGAESVGMLTIHLARRYRDMTRCADDARLSKARVTVERLPEVWSFVQELRALE